MTSVRRALALVASVVVMAACSSSDEPAPPEFVIRPEVRVLDAASLEKLRTVSAEGVLTFEGHDAAIDALAEGHVVAGAIAKAAPSGLLRKVTRATRTDAGVVLETRQATLPEAIERGHLHLSRPLAVSDVAGPKPATTNQSFTGFYVGFDREVVYDGGSASARVSATGSVSAEPLLDFDADIDLTGVHSLSFAVGGTQSAALTLEGGAGVKFEEKKDVATYNFVPFVIYAGPVPIVFTPRLVFEFGASGRFDTKTTVGIVEQATAKVGLAYSGGSFSPIATAEPSFSYGPPQTSAGATVKAWAGGRAELLVYGIMGPYGTLEGYLRFDADSNAKPCWNLKAGIESRFGLKIDVFGLKIVDTNTTVLDRSKSLASGDCGSDPSVVPGPWAYRYARDGYDGANAVAAMPGGGLVLAGESSLDAAVTRLGNDGAIVWQKRLPIGKLAHAVAASSDAVFVAGGNWVAKLDAKNGNVLWSNAYASAPEVRAIDVTADGGCVLAGNTESPNNDEDYWFAKLASNGAVTWSFRMGDGKWEQVNGVRAVAGGGYVLVGQYAVNQDADAFFARLDAAGNVTLQRRFDGVGFELFEAALPVSGGTVVVGQAQRPGLGSGWAAKLDDAGSLVWSKAFGESGVDTLSAVVPTSTGYLATGSTGLLPSTAWAVSLDPTGHPIWSRGYAAIDTSKGVEGRGLSLFTDGTFAFAGRAEVWGGSDVFAAHVAFDGQLALPTSSGMKVVTLSGTSETPQMTATTTSLVPVAYPLAVAGVPVSAVENDAKATKLAP